MLRRQFFELLRSGLWGYIADSNMFVDTIVDWESIWRLSKEQAVVGIVYEGVMTLPEPLRSKDLFQWQYITIKIEEINKFQLDELSNIIEKLTEKGVTPLLLKGHGIAQYYLNPYRRQSGDIDLFSNKEDYKKINEALIEMGATQSGTESIKHSAFCLNKVDIENHKTSCSMHSPRNRKKWYVFEKEELKAGDEYLKLPSNSIRIPSVDFNTCYIFDHAFHHLLRGGIGLRQFCDWARFIYVNRERINREKVIQTLENLGLLQAASLFEEFLVEYLGFPSERRLFDKFEDKSILDNLLEDIILAGNFGHYDNRKYHVNGFFKKKLNNFRINKIRQKKYSSVSGPEAKWMQSFSIFLNIYEVLFKIRARFS